MVSKMAKTWKFEAGFLSATVKKMTISIFETLAMRC
jgi:hypothetical protein